MGLGFRRLCAWAGGHEGKSRRSAPRCYFSPFIPWLAPLCPDLKDRVSLLGCWGSALGCLNSTCGLIAMVVLKRYCLLPSVYSSPRLPKSKFHLDFEHTPQGRAQLHLVLCVVRASVCMCRGLSSSARPVTL